MSPVKWHLTTEKMGDANGYLPNVFQEQKYRSWPEKVSFCISVLDFSSWKTFGWYPFWSLTFTWKKDFPFLFKSSFGLAGKGVKGSEREQVGSRKDVPITVWICWGVDNALSLQQTCKVMTHSNARSKGVYSGWHQSEMREIEFFTYLGN